MRWRKDDEADQSPESAAADPDVPEADGPVSPWGYGEPGDAGYSTRPDSPVDLTALDDGQVERAIRRVVARALAEDLGDEGDLTVAATVPPGASGTAHIVGRQDGVVSGLDLVTAVFAQVDPRVEVEPHVSEGDRVERGASLATLSGPLRSILIGERAALNLLAHLSGVATRTRAFADAVDGTDAVVRDTRKTTAGFRVLEKRAVRSGGGHNHRLNLSEALLVKENHVAATGSVTGAVEAALAAAGGRHVQVEVTSLHELEEALQAGATDVLLDNMSVDEVRQAVARTRGRSMLEASGGITLETAADYAATGVDRLAIGSLTHSAPWLDVALEVSKVDTPEWSSDRPWNGDPEPAPSDASPGGDTGGDREQGGDPGDGAAVDEVTDAGEQGESSSGDASRDETASGDTGSDDVDDDTSGGLFAWRERQG
ncbi:MAG: carboxylating nicotinate-nucleotide diphosphorylase [Nitriliruptorales bacterium]|nr:carboxylating nicotinate-nucleotide diphosphorylase [Nitriliruptorales bacterium]